MTKKISLQKVQDLFYLAATVEGRSQRTLELYKQTLTKFIKLIGEKPLIEINTDDIRGFLLVLEEAGYAPATKWTHFKYLKVFFNFLVSEDHIDKSPMAPLKSPKIPKIYPKILTEEEVKRLFRASKGKSFEAKRNYALLLVFIDTGIRVSEAVSLTLKDVDLATYTMKIFGKGSKERVVHFGREAAKAISAYIKTRGILPHEDSFLVSRQGEPLTRSGILQTIRRLAQKAGIQDKQVSPHVLRHCAATFWIKAGGDPHTLRKQLGHTDSRMTDIYVNLVGKDLADAHRKYSPVGHLFSGKPIK